MGSSSILEKATSALEVAERRRQQDAERARLDAEAEARREAEFYIDFLARADQRDAGDYDGLADFCEQFEITAEKLRADREFVRQALELEALHDRRDAVQQEYKGIAEEHARRTKEWFHEEMRLLKEKLKAANRAMHAGQAASRLREMAAARPRFFQAGTGDEPPRLIRGAQGSPLAESKG
jgi:hypothetical protein